MPRMLRRAAVLGATAHVAANRGEARAEAQQAPPEAAPIPAQAAPAPAAEAADPYEDLMKLKGLLDAGALTQAEFDIEKQKILGA
jgi:Short C-terminal domain